MKNIKGAINAEQEYLAKIERGEPSEPLISLIGKYGYENFDDFYLDKTMQSIKEIDLPVYEINDSFDSVVNEKVSANEPCICYNINIGKTIAYVPNDFHEYDKLESNHIESYNMKYGGNSDKKSVIITGDGDLKIGIMLPYHLIHEAGNSKFLLNGISSILSKYINGIKVSNNDIIDENGKIAGSAIANIGNLCIFYIQITFSDKRKLIENICGVSNKRPSYVRRDKVSPNKLLNNIVKWLKQ